MGYASSRRELLEIGFYKKSYIKQSLGVRFLIEKYPVDRFDKDLFYKEFPESPYKAGRTLGGSRRGYFYCV